MVLCRGSKIYFSDALLSVVEQTHFDWWYTETHIQVIPQMELYPIIRLHPSNILYQKYKAVKRQLTGWSKKKMFSEVFSGFAVNSACLHVQSIPCTAFFHSLVAASIGVTSDCVPRFTRLKSHPDHVQFVVFSAVSRQHLQFSSVLWLVIHQRTLQKRCLHMTNTGRSRAVYPHHSCIVIRKSTENG